jgi:hypothetical protein
MLCGLIRDPVVNKKEEPERCRPWRAREPITGICSDRQKRTGTPFRCVPVLEFEVAGGLSGYIGRRRQKHIKLISAGARSEYDSIYGLIRRGLEHCALRSDFESQHSDTVHLLTVYAQASGKTDFYQYYGSQQPSHSQRPLRILRSLRGGADVNLSTSKCSQ